MVRRRTCSDEIDEFPNDSGEPGGNRTPNPQIKSLLLCQLSYRPAARAGVPSEAIPSKRQALIVVGRRAPAQVIGGGLRRCAARHLSELALDLGREQGAVVPADALHLDAHRRCVSVLQAPSSNRVAALVTTRVPATVKVRPGHVPIRSEIVPRTSVSLSSSPSSSSSSSSSPRVHFDLRGGDDRAVARALHDDVIANPQIGERERAVAVADDRGRLHDHRLPSTRSVRAPASMRVDAAVDVARRCRRTPAPSSRAARRGRSASPKSAAGRPPRCR